MRMKPPPVVNASARFLICHEEIHYALHRLSRDVENGGKIEDIKNLFFCVLFGH